MRCFCLSHNHIYVRTVKTGSRLEQLGLVARVVLIFFAALGIHDQVVQRQPDLLLETTTTTTTTTTTKAAAATTI